MICYKISKMKKALPYIYSSVLVCLACRSCLPRTGFPDLNLKRVHVYPTNQLPLQRSEAWEYIDVAVLIVALSVTAWLALKKRSRRGLIWMSVFSLAYFGFFRQGCICSVGSVQNVSLALFNTAIRFRLLPFCFLLYPWCFPGLRKGFLCRCMPAGSYTGAYRYQSAETHQRR